MDTAAVPPPTRRGAAVTLAALLLAAVGSAGGPLLRLQHTGGPFGYGLGERSVDTRPTTPPTALATPSAATPAAPSTGTALHPLLVVLGVLLGLVIVGAVVLLVRRAVPTRAAPQAPTAARSGGAATVADAAVATAGLRQGALAARLEAQAPGDARGRVLRAWGSLERAVERTGRARGPGETSAQLTRRVLREHAVRPGPLAELHALYDTARWSDAEPDPGAPARADALLAQIEGDLAGAPARP